MARKVLRYLCPSPENIAACTDFYELTMAAGYYAHDIRRRATFELYVRKLPRNRSFLVAAGLEQALSYLESLRFSTETIRLLKGHPAFARVPREFFRYLSKFRFAADVYAVPEGTVVFPGEPLLSVRGPVIDAQIVETLLLTTICYQTAVASKAARIVHAARGRPVADFGSRRAHGPQAGLLAARAAYVAGCAATSNVLAGQELDIPVTGTQAHSWVMAFTDEMESFKRYHEVFPESTILLIDTYDTLEGARRAASIGPAVKAVRLDSGDIVSLSRKVRKILDDAGLRHVKIIASSDLNEHRIDRILRRGGRVDMFGVGTEMVALKDDPALSGVYKLVEIERNGRFQPATKLSRGKPSLPHLKQVRRRFTSRGRFLSDTVCLYNERLPGEPLLRPVMRKGKIVRRLPEMREIQRYCREQLKRLPPRLLDISKRAAYRVRISPKLRQAHEEAIRKAK